MKLYWKFPFYIVNNQELPISLYKEGFWLVTFFILTISIYSDISILFINIDDLILRPYVSVELSLSILNGLVNDTRSFVRFSVCR